MQPPYPPPPGPSYPQPPYPPPQAMYAPPQQSLWRCQFCGYTGPPAVKQKTTTGGWIVFVALLFLCIVLCWLGLLIKEERAYCPHCQRLAVK